MKREPSAHFRSTCQKLPLKAEKETHNTLHHLPRWPPVSSWLETPGPFHRDEKCLITKLD